jgi:hypothetical protein
MHGRTKRPAPRDGGPSLASIEPATIQANRGGAQTTKATRYHAGSIGGPSRMTLALHLRLVAVGAQELAQQIRTVLCRSGSLFRGMGGAAEVIDDLSNAKKDERGDQR